MTLTSGAGVRGLGARPAAHESRRLRRCIDLAIGVLMCAIVVAGFWPTFTGWLGRMLV